MVVVVLGTYVFVLGALWLADRWLTRRRTPAERRCAVCAAPDHSAEWKHADPAESVPLDCWPGFDR